MAGKKDNVVVSVISDLTSNQAADISKHIMLAKQKYAPKGRGTIAMGKKQSVGHIIQNSFRQKKLTGK